jgi:penicillin-binding protein 1A
MVSPWVREGVILVEDQRFYDHDGYDPQGILRAAWANTRGDTQGGSTITQQMIRDKYPSVGKEYSYKRKLKEVHYAQEYERGVREQYPTKKSMKDSILQDYLNNVYFGSGAYGIEAAALRYYALHAKQLNIAQSAYLVGIIQSPARYTANRELGKARRDTVLKIWRDDGFITQEQYRIAQKSPLPRVQLQARDAFRGQWSGLARLVEDELSPRYPNLKTGGYTVTTTLQGRMQTIVREALAENLAGDGMPMGAMVIIENSTGAVRASAQYPSRGWFDTTTQARRQPGSSAKIWALLAAVEQGWNLEERYYVSEPLSIPLSDGSSWRPETYSGRYGGNMNLRAATVASDNSVFAQLTMDLGPEKVAQAARNGGINRPLEAVPSIGLGSVGVTPYEQTAFYATLARGGSYIPPHVVSSVKSRGQTVYQPTPTGEQRYSRAGVSLIVDYLYDNALYGTGQRSLLTGYWVVGKTGTTDDYKDAWYCGITLRYTSCVWIGYRYPKSMYLPGWGSVSGGGLPTQIWHDAMIQLLPERDRGKKPEWVDTWRSDKSWVKNDV